MRKMSLIILVLLMSFVFIGTSCEQGSVSDRRQREATDKLLAEGDRQVGMPDIVNFQQRKLMKMIYELCDKEDLVCYVYIKSDYQGKLVFIGKCVGYGIPFSAQYTNPQRIIGDRPYHNSNTIPQADPNGLFMPTSSSATWLMMIAPDGKVHPVYLEPEIVVSPFPLTADSK